MALDREKILQAAQKYVEKKKYDKAIAEYQKIIQQDPNDARTLLKIGDLQARMEAYAEAIATYDRVGQFYAAQGFALKAIAVYKQIRELIKKHVPQLEDRYGHIVPKLARSTRSSGSRATRSPPTTRSPRGCSARAATATRSTCSARWSRSTRRIRCRTCGSPRRAAACSRSTKPSTRSGRPPSS